jgi:hypothetical protein
MFEAVILIKLLPTSILDIYKVFEPLVCCIKGIWVHPYIIPVAKKLAPDLGILCCSESGNDANTSCLRLSSTSDCIKHKGIVYMHGLKMYVKC